MTTRLLHRSALLLMLVAAVSCAQRQRAEVVTGDAVGGNSDIPVDGVSMEFKIRAADSLGLNTIELTEIVERAATGPMVLPDPPSTRRETESLLVTVGDWTYSMTDRAQWTFLHDSLPFEDFFLADYPAITDPPFYPASAEPPIFIYDPRWFFPFPEIILDDDPRPKGAIRIVPPEEEPEE